MTQTIGATGPLPVRDANPQAYSIFQQPWWLDAVAPGQWSEVQVQEEGQVRGRLPFVSKRRFGLQVLSQPMLTQCLGPWLQVTARKYKRQLTEEKQLLTELIRQLPEHDYFVQNFDHALSNWLPFYWQGFTQTTLYTYVLDDLADPERIFRNFDDGVRSAIRKAQKKLVVRADQDLERVLDVNELSFRRQGLKVPYSRDLVRRIDAACVARDCSVRFTAEDAEGRIHATAYMVWDERSSHGLFSGQDPELRTSGAGALLKWEAIQFAARVTKSYNFGGSMIRPVEYFVRGFGGRQVEYHRLTRMSRRMRILTSCQNALNALRNRPYVCS